MIRGMVYFISLISQVISPWGNRPSTSCREKISFRCTVEDAAFPSISLIFASGRLVSVPPTREAWEGSFKARSIQ
jgi:hypothetical protein